MPWFILTLSCIILWGFTDILLKKSLHHSDPLSQFKTFIWIGLVMTLAGCIMAICSDTLLNSIKMVGDNLYLIPLCIFYVIALFFGLLGTKHLEASVVSPLENIDGAIASIMDIIGTIAIVVGVVFLGIQEQKFSNQEINLDKNKKKHRLGALALIFPIVYNLVDAASMVAMGITVSGEAEVSIPDIDFFIFECAGFAIAAVFVWLYLLIVKKCVYNPFKKTELTRCGAGVSDTLGTIAFTFAIALNPILTAPITSSYCLVTIILARIFLKERLTKKQYLILAILLIGIALLGVSEIFKI